MGEGKTTVSIGLNDALKKINKNSIAVLREPSMGPVFGMKGGATGGGYSQVIPMEDINLQFTGDFDAISAANNLICAAIDNHIYFDNKLDIQKVTFNRCLDVNDRFLRSIKGEREAVDPNYYTYAEVMEKYHFTKDQVAYYIHNYNIDNHKQGRFTVINRKEFDRIIKERMETNALAQEVERRKKQPKVTAIPDGYVTTAQIAEKYGVTVKHVQAKTREAKIPKLHIKNMNYYNEAAIEKLFSRDPDTFDVPEDYITAQNIAKRFKVTVHHVHGRTREANVPKITIKNVNFYELKAVEELFAKNEADEELKDREASEWITGIEVEDMMGITTCARRTFVSRHKIPSKKEHGITYYLRSAIENVNNVLTTYGDLYFTVEQIIEKFNMNRDKVYSMVRYNNIRKVQVGRFALYLKEDVIRTLHEKYNKLS